MQGGNNNEVNRAVSGIKYDEILKMIILGLREKVQGESKNNSTKMEQIKEAALFLSQQLGESQKKFNTALNDSFKKKYILYINRVGAQHKSKTNIMMTLKILNLIIVLKQTQNRHKTDTDFQSKVSLKKETRMRL